MNKKFAVVSFIDAFGDTQVTSLEKEEYQLALIPMTILFESDNFDEVSNYIWEIENKKAIDAFIN